MPKKSPKRRGTLSVSAIIILLIGVLIGVFAVSFVIPKPKPQPNASPKLVNNTGAKIGPPPEFMMQLPPGFVSGVFAQNLGNPRDLEFSPGGTLLASIPKNGTVVALPDQNQDGLADETKTIAANLHGPHGIAFFNNQLFIAEEQRVTRYLWDEQTLTATFDKELFLLPSGSGHNTRSLLFNKSGQLFVSIGSSCNVCTESHDWRAAVIVSNADGSTPQLFAKGLRNAVFLAIHPETDAIWVTEMGRDYLGDFTPPDEVNILQSNRDYGWPLCWGDKIHDTLFDKNQYIRDPCALTEAPQFGIAAHSAPLGLTFIPTAQFPAEWKNDLLVAYHGSWNRTSPIGYKVVRLDLDANNVVAEEDFLTGFIKNEQVLGRPVDLTFDTAGSLYLSDDKTGAVYKVIYTSNKR